MVGCRRDGYVAQRDTEALAAHWAGSTLRWLEAGHISALLLHRAELRGAVAEALTRLG